VADGKPIKGQRDGKVTDKLILKDLIVKIENSKTKLK